MPSILTVLYNGHFSVAYPGAGFTEKRGCNEEHSNGGLILHLIPLKCCNKMCRSFRIMTFLNIAVCWTVERKVIRR